MSPSRIRRAPPRRDRQEWRRSRCALTVSPAARRRREWLQRNSPCLRLTRQGGGGERRDRELSLRFATAPASKRSSCGRSRAGAGHDVFLRRTFRDARTECAPAPLAYFAVTLGASPQSLSSP